MSIVASVMKKLHTRKILKTAEKNMKKDGAYKIVKHINKKTGVVSLIGKQNKVKNTIPLVYWQTVHKFQKAMHNCLLTTRHAQTKSRQ